MPVTYVVEYVLVQIAICILRSSQFSMLCCATVSRRRCRRTGRQIGLSYTMNYLLSLLVALSFIMYARVSMLQCSWSQAGVISFPGAFEAQRSDH